MAASRVSLFRIFNIKNQHPEGHVITMAPEKIEHPSVKDGRLQDSAFLRFLNLPVISSTCEMVERTYASTKRTHPLIFSVCGVYERGARTAGSLAVWSVRPAIHRLEPQIEAVNSLACKGLDRLEQKIPALQYPPEKLASDITEAVTSTVQTAKLGIAGTFTGTSDVALSLAAGGYQLTKRVVSDGVRYVTSSRPVRLATEGADTALTLTEHLVNYILPPSDEELEEDALWEQAADGELPACQPGYRRLGALATTVCRRAFNQTSTQLHQAKTQSQQLIRSIPGVNPLTSLATSNLEVAGVVQGLQTTVEGLLVGTDHQTDKERRKKKEGDVLKSGGLKGLLAGLGQQIQSAYMSMVSTVKSTPTTALGLAREGTGGLLRTLGSARQYLLETATRYGLLPGLLPEGGANRACPTIKEEEEEEEEEENKAPHPSETS